VLLTQVNIGLIEQALTAREVEIWRGRQVKFARRHHGEAFVDFVEDREEWGLGEHCLHHEPQRERDNPSALRRAKEL
jgi:hypothetical protein